MSRFNINGIMGNQSDFNDFIGTLNIYDDNSASGIIYNRDGRHQNSKIVILWTFFPSPHFTNKPHFN